VKALLVSEAWYAGDRLLKVAVPERLLGEYHLATSSPTMCKRLAECAGCDQTCPSSARLGSASHRAPRGTRPQA